MPFEPGTYRGQLKEAVCCEAKTGNLQLALKFDVTEHWNGSGWGGVSTPSERTVFLSLTDKAWPYSSAKLERLNFNGNFEKPEFSLDPAGVDLVCSEESFNGAMKERWELGGFGVAREQAATDKLKRLNSRWRATATKKPTAPPAPLTPPTSSSKPVRTSTRDKAWEALCETWSGKSEDEIKGKWFEAIGERSVPEEQFTPEDWGHVEVAVAIPF